MPISMQGNQVRGSYTRPGGSIEGVVNGNQLDGRWVQRDRWGILRFVLAPDGQSFDGLWAEANGTGGGPWNGRCSDQGQTVSRLATAPAFEMDVDRPGQDIGSFDLPQPDPGLCLAACQANGQCRAFTFVKPGIQGGQARCWLKSAVAPPVRSSCCISGQR